MLNRLLLFILAACLGTIFLKMELPIPYLMGGIAAAVAANWQALPSAGLKAGASLAF